MSKSLFSKYSQGENRITSTILSVFSKINLFTLQEILKFILNDVDVELVKFDNQIKERNKNSVPDARISASFDYLFETKIEKNSLKVDQINGHLEYLNRSSEKDEKLIILTPDFEEPAIIQDYPDNKVYWLNFDTLLEGLQSVIDNYPFLTDREKFVLLELSNFIIESNLTSEDISNKVLIIPSSRLAFRHYQSLQVYICQPNRTFQRASYLGYYGKHRIHKEIPKILGIIEDYDFILNDHQNAELKLVDGGKEKDLRERLERLKEDLLNNDFELFDSVKIVFLSRTPNEGTVILPNDIENDKLSYSGKRTAYVQKQVYENLIMMKDSKYTSDLK